MENTYPVDKTFGRPVPGAAYFHRPGAYLLALEGGLLALAETPKGWFLPGGGIEPGESHPDCIRRECAEELDRDARVGAYLGCAQAYLAHPEIPFFHPVQFFYTGALGPALCQPAEPDHVLALVPAEQAAEKLYLETQRWAVRTWLEQAGR